MKTPVIDKSPSSTADLTGSQLRTYQAIFQHPISHSLEWQAVRTLLGKLGDVSDEPNGNMKVTRHGETLVLHPSRTKEIADMDELMTLRHFLERTETIAPATDTAPALWLLVIDHREARIFRSEMHGDMPQRILPHAPEEFFRHVQDSKEVSRGKEKPDPNSYFEPVATALQGAGEIIIFGTGTGSSSEMDQFVGWLNKHHPDLANRVIGSLPVDEHHLSEGQLLAKAREFYTNKSK